MSGSAPVQAARANRRLLRRRKEKSFIEMAAMSGWSIEGRLRQYNFGILVRFSRVTLNKGSLNNAEMGLDGIKRVFVAHVLPCLRSRPMKQSGGGKTMLDRRQATIAVIRFTADVLCFFAGLADQGKLSFMTRTALAAMLSIINGKRSITGLKAVCATLFGAAGCFGKRDGVVHCLPGAPCPSPRTDPRLAHAVLQVALKMRRRSVWGSEFLSFHARRLLKRPYKSRWRGRGR